MANATETYEETVEEFWDAQDDPLLSNQEDTVGSNTSCTDSCPEQADVTVTETTLQLSSLIFDIDVNDLSPVDLTKKNIVIQLEDSDGSAVLQRVAVNLRWVDNDTVADVVSPNPPSSIIGAEAVKHTDPATGKIEFEVENTNPTDTWYLAVEAGAGVIVSGAVTIGV